MLIRLLDYVSRPMPKAHFHTGVIQNVGPICRASVSDASQKWRFTETPYNCAEICVICGR